MKEIVRAIALLTLLALTGCGWSVQEAHVKANDVLVRVGDWCSGTVIDKKRGLVVTAAHCTSRMREVTNTKKETWDGKLVNVSIVKYKVTLTIERFNMRGKSLGQTSYAAIMLGKNDGADVAVLQITSSLALLRDAATMSNRPVEFDDRVFAIGNPEMIPHVISEGRVSQPAITLGPNTTVPVIMFSAVIAPGSSGGGLWNNSGQLVGITNWVCTDCIAAWATPVSHVRDLMKELNL